MSDHAHDTHAQVGHDAHADAHGHDAHHDDHGHGGGVGDYNTLPPGPSTLPPVSASQMFAMGIALAFLLAAIAHFSVYMPAVESGGTHGEKHAPNPEHRTSTDEHGS